MFTAMVFLSSCVWLVLCVAFIFMQLALAAFVVLVLIGAIFAIDSWEKLGKKIASIFKK